MKILAIETSALTASVAVAEDNKIIGLYSSNYKKTHSQTIMPMIQELKKNIELNLSELDLIAVSAGPGSFTGLRIGSASAKGLAHVLNLPIASIPTLEALAYNISYTDRLICPMMDARRNRVFGAGYIYEGNELKQVVETVGEEVELFIQKIRKFNKDIIFLGDGYKVNSEIIIDTVKDVNYVEAPIHSRYQSAASVAALAFKYADNNQLESYLEHKPVYLKKSQAEREYEARQKDASN